MMDAAAVPGILDAVYDSALFPGRWPQALEKLGQAFDCTSVALIDRNLRTLEGRVSASGVDASSQREFLDLWSARDIVRLRTRSWRPGAIEPDHHIVPRHELLASDYYNGFMKPRDMRTVMRLTLAHQNQFHHHHQPGTAAFRRGFRHRRDRAVPGADAASAARVHDPVPGARRRLHAGRALRCRRPLDRGDAVAGAGREGEIRQQGGAGDGGRRRPSLRGAQFEVANRNDDAALQRLIAGATGALQGIGAPRGGVQRLARSSGKASYTVTVAPVQRDTSWIGNEPMALVLISDPDLTPVPSREMLHQLFGLSASETRVAERLMMGDSPEQAAAFLNVKTATVRWHLVSMYRKTGTNRQAELVRLLLSLAMI